MKMYGHILYIIIYWCFRDCYVPRLLCFFFSVLVSLMKFRNALGNEKTAKLVFIFKDAFIFVNKKLYVCKFKYLNIFIKK